MKKSIILHFSDLHLGSDPQSLRIPQVLSLIQSDIQNFCSNHNCGVDAVVFTGDLVHSGQEDQFIEFESGMTAFMRFLRETLGGDPCFLAVPGNHDMERPSPYDPYSTLINDKYFIDDDFQNNFWKDGSDYINQINKKYFKNYDDWYKNTALKKPPICYNGLFAGDFSTKFEVDGINISIVGLNSAIFHFSDSAFQTLELSEKQLYKACNKDIGGFCSDTDFCLLLTHHGKDWLYPSPNMNFDTFIYPPGRFFAHLYGHVHASQSIDQNISGSESRRYLQGKSLFGLEKFLNEGGQKKNRYDVGYNIIRISMDDSSKKCEIWPRTSIHKTSGTFTIGEDPGYNLSEDGSLLLGQIARERPVPGPVVVPGNLANMGQNILSRRTRLFTQPNRNRLSAIEDKVKDLWENHQGPSWEAYHDFRHNLTVENLLYDIIPENKEELISEEDWFCLIAASWLHEIGMIIGLNEDDHENFNNNEEAYILEIRETHQKRVAEYLDINKADFMIDQDETEFQVIKDLCFFHRIHENSLRLDEELDRFHPQLTSAYLRLALLIHLDHQINDNDLFELLHTPGIAWETKFHWLKIKWIKDIQIQHDSSEIKLYCYGPSMSSSLINFLPEKIVEDMQEKFGRLRDILIKGGISFFTDISYSFSGKLLPDRYVSEMELVKSNIELEELSSASEAYDTILNTFTKFSESRYRPYDLIESYFRSIEKVLGKRPCHVLIRSLIQKLNSMFNSTPDHDKLIAKIREIAETRKEKREKIQSLIRKYARPFVEGSTSILLYGYSTLVIDALMAASSEDRKNCEIYIGECRGKTQYNDQNRMIYNDGIHYMEKLKQMKFKNIYLIADITVGNLMNRGKIQKVFFGANGIDRETGSFGHTCGHLAIADLAKTYKKPVFVIADTSKIGDLKWEAEINRDIKWLPYYREYEKIFDEKQLINPREDTVESDKISLIITEKGPKLPEEIKNLFDSKD